MTTANKAWITVTAATALLAGVYVYQQTKPMELEHNISILERMEEGQKISSQDLAKLTSDLESNDSARQRDALGVGKMSKEPEVQSLVRVWSQKLIHSADEDLRHVSLIALMKVGDPTWKEKANYLAKNDPSQFVRDGAQAILAKQ